MRVCCSGKWHNQNIKDEGVGIEYEGKIQENPTKTLALPKKNESPVPDSVIEPSVTKKQYFPMEYYDEFSTYMVHSIVK